MTFTLLLAIAVLVSAAYFLASRKKTNLATLTWEDLVARLEPVSIDGIAKVAIDYLHPVRGQLAIETDEMWSLIGGVEGLRRMQANAEVLIALAGFAQQWNFQESVIVGERMRRDGLALRRASRQVSVQEAASAYYVMRGRLLTLYQTSHAGRYQPLAVALGGQPSMLVGLAL
jgi:hypothetical protein